MTQAGRKNEPGIRFRDQASTDALLVELASTQHAVFGLEQLRNLGLGARAIQKRAASSRLHRRHRGVYSLVPRDLLTREGHLMAAVLACGPGAALSHRSAAALLGLRDWGWTKIEVTVPSRSSRKHEGVAVHRSSTLTSADVTRVRNIPCTTPARTLLDLAEVVNRRQLERAFDQSEILELFDLHALEDQMARNRRRTGATRVRAVLEEHYIGSTATHNELEEAFLGLCRAAGLPDPQVNKWIDLGDGEQLIWADFVWPEQRVIVETDGRRVHGTHQARERDPRRDQRAVLAGWRPVRTTWRQVTRRPHELRPTIIGLVKG